MNVDRRTRSVQLTTFALTAAGSLAACGAANTPETATPPVAAEAAQTPAPPAEPAAPTPAASAPVYEQEPQRQTSSGPPSEPRATAGNEQAAPENKIPEPTSVTITTLSKGRGVPAPARDAYKQIRGLLEEQQSQSAVTNIDTQRVGIEGEMRMCAEFRDRDQAEYTLEQIRKISTDVELLNVVEGPCPPTQRDKP